ncbi:hypothetical protein A5731_22780 [Mycolicibacterium conceptionense]|uniref:Helix-turn-helix domain-containing protein n=1 Tax=Mycolicibacterium conceptionense TaxID=451644 RepID=A0A1A1YH27_9MYCO|nr:MULTISPECIES: helix-turn-helix domain-containing protein [Mycolicibacterium]MCW1820795.1 helix-turn-helix domain-containing protein [Mycolicibacterium senegalense]OBB10699.1 hypothetical protein A5718_07760 [Mycolicibacterium conceptionense]OBE98523.1 hypothetical protein A5731_22780 [Mycolicibacterium conceptionense]OBF15054.1 hypothetical protein A5726_23020 [Mycolicibacterium conceptionense]OBF30613.1 hypothetical protein A5720_29665 [Mycolicibacterium conceptionense]
MSRPIDKFAYIAALDGADLTPIEYRVLITVWRYTDGHGQHAYASAKRLAHDCRISERSARRSLQVLTEKRYLRRVNRGGRDSEARASEYALRMPANTSRAGTAAATQSQPATGGRMDRKPTGQGWPDGKKPTGHTASPNRPHSVSQPATGVTPTEPDQSLNRAEVPPNPPQHVPAPADPITNGDGTNVPAKQTRNPGRDIAQAYSASLPNPIEDRLVGAISVQVNRCLDAGVTLAAIRDGLRAWTASDAFAPTQIPAFVHKAAAANNGHRSTADDRVRDVQALKAKFPKPDGSTA